MKTNYLKTVLAILTLSFFLSYCGNCDDGLNYEDQPQNQPKAIDSVHIRK